ncbi:MAG: deoxyribodipyrimidine photolyase, partial [Planctomycetes bacterium]|nr:deoxyribodipyrimidine photolyase [Planctomycetota bacterium]
MQSVPNLRILESGSSAECRADGDYVLYWMIANRRTHWNFSLQRAVDWASDLKKPLLVFEPLRCGYRWASDRLHRFVIQGMADNQRRLRDTGVLYYPYLEPRPGEGRGLLRALADRACVVISDDFPCFFLPRMIESAARQIPVRFELIDSNGLLPMRAADRVFARAYDFRRFLQRELRPHLEQLPDADPLHRRRLAPLPQLPPDIARRWPAADPSELLNKPSGLSDFPIDHSVPPTKTEGGSQAAGSVLRRFLDDRLENYAERRNEPEVDATSGLSPYLHFGHISAHEVFSETMRQDHWSPEKLSSKATGSSEGWWGTGKNVEAFLDELITWREVGYNMCWQRDDYDRYDSLPDWAKKTLHEHAGDQRPNVYRMDQFEAGETHDS